MQDPQSRSSSSRSQRREYHVETDRAPLGAGGCGTVYRAFVKDTREPVAVKLVDKTELTDAQVCAARGEAAMMRRAPPHPHLLPLLDSDETPRHVVLVTPLVEGCTLSSALAANSCVDEDAARELLRNLLSAIAHLHQHGIMHRDIKPENVLLRGCRNGRNVLRDPVLIDFGFATDEVQAHHAVGTPFAVAPEVIATARDKSKAYDKACDVWSFGVLAYMVLQGGARPFSGATPSACYRAIEQNAPWWSHPCSAMAKRFVEYILVSDPAQRPTAEDALQHPWLAAHECRSGSTSSGHGPALSSHSPSSASSCELRQMSVSDDAAYGVLDHPATSESPLHSARTAASDAARVSGGHH